MGNMQNVQHVKTIHPYRSFFDTISLHNNMKIDLCQKIESLQCNDQIIESGNSVQGCIYKFLETTKDHLIILGAVGLGLSVLELFGIVLGSCLYIKLRHDFDDWELLQIRESNNNGRSWCRYMQNGDGTVWSSYRKRKKRSGRWKEILLPTFAIQDFLRFWRWNPPSLSKRRTLGISVLFYPSPKGRLRTKRLERERNEEKWSKRCVAFGSPWRSPSPRKSSKTKLFLFLLYVPCNAEFNGKKRSKKRSNTELPIFDNETVAKSSLPFVDRFTSARNPISIELIGREEADEKKNSVFKVHRLPARLNESQLILEYWPGSYHVHFPYKRTMTILEKNVLKNAYSKVCLFFVVSNSCARIRSFLYAVSLSRGRTGRRSSFCNGTASITMPRSLATSDLWLRRTYLVSLSANVLPLVQITLSLRILP